MKSFFSGLLLLVIVFGAFSAPVFASPRPDATDWYIEDFKTDITVRPDGGLDIVEDILADCGQCSDRHGIFRVVPNRVKTKEGNSYATPITLTGITDEQGSAYNYSESESKKDGTITWKIGDPDITISGEHHYIISYSADRAIRDQTTFDELYWNLIGGFWELEMDHVSAMIHLPETLSQKDIQLYTYAGPQGSNSDSKAWMTSQWVDEHTLSLESTQTFPERHDMTVSLSFPKGLVTSYIPSAEDASRAFWDRFISIMNYALVVIPIIVFIICFLHWRRHGKDPKVNKTIIAEYEAPEKLSPLMMRLVQTYGQLDTQAITAGIIDFAINNILLIKEITPAKFLSSAKYSLEKQPVDTWKRALSKSEQALLDALFKSGDIVQLTDLKESFHNDVKGIEKIAETELTTLGFIAKGKGTSAGTIMQGFAIALFVVAYFVWGSSTWLIALSIIVSGLIILLFSLIMEKYTEKGAETMWKIKGFKLYMETVEKYRQQWNEKQNFFEEMLPYAIAFDMTKKWISKMKDLGAIPVAGFVPMWFIGSHAFSSFDELASGISAISSEIGSNVTTTSGSSGGGFSGGGGGGGGGGGW